MEGLDEGFSAGARSFNCGSKTGTVGDDYTGVSTGWTFGWRSDTEPAPTIPADVRRSASVKPEQTDGRGFVPEESNFAIDEDDA
jgi:hypothetical protein